MYFFAVVEDPLSQGQGGRSKVWIKKKKIDIFIKGDVFVVEVVLDRGIVIIALDKEKLIFLDAETLL